MGGSLSHQALNQHKRFLNALCGTTPLHISDPFWSQFAQFPAQLSSFDPREVQKTLEPYCRQLVVNSRKTGNLQTLILRVTGVTGTAETSDQKLTAANGICFIRFVFKSLLEKLQGPDFISFIEQQSFVSHHERDGLLKNFVKSLVGVVLVGSVGNYGYLVMVEALLCLLVGCSSQLYVELVNWSFGTHPILELLMTEEQDAAQVLQNLLSWYIHPLSPPYGVKIYQKPSEDNPNVFKFVRKAAVSVLWFPVTAFKYLVGSSSSENFSPLAEASQHLLMILVHHVPYKSSATNPYRDALRTLHDLAFMGGVESQDKMEFHVPSVRFSDLYEQLARSLKDERGTLMLYTMLQCVHSFRDYATVRTDLQTMMIPLLKQSYEVSLSSQSQLYLLSIVLLILSQDTSFCQEVHKVEIHGPEWFKERLLGKISLGSFIVLLLMRTAHRNVASLRDVYLHTNTMAALANVACFSYNLDSYASQKFLSLIELINRKYQKLKMEPEDLLDRDQRETRLQFFRDFLHMMLEILNGTICQKPANNPNLVYALLQRQNLFDDLFHISHDFRDLTENIQIVAQYFSSAIDKERGRNPEAAYNVHQVLEMVKLASQMWTTNNLRGISDLRFSYEEEDSAEQFFVPVVWTLLVTYSGIPWNTDSISLFSSETPTASAIESEGIHLELMSSTSNGMPDAQP